MAGGWPPPRRTPCWAPTPPSTSTPMPSGSSTPSGAPSTSRTPSMSRPGRGSLAVRECERAVSPGSGAAWAVREIGRPSSRVRATRGERSPRAR
eukprot:12690299-Alexandrium_andersonii.AAC.1